MSAGEFARLVKLDRMPSGLLTIEAEETERAALARRFGVEAIEALSASLELTRDGSAIEARGQLRASLIQLCAVSNAPFSTAINEPLAIRFVPALAIPDEEEEIEFDPDAPDEVEYAGNAIDVGETVAQSLGLAIDPYALGPQAEAARGEAGISDENTPAGPFAALAALKTP